MLPLAATTQWPHLCPCRCETRFCPEVSICHEGVRAKLKVVWLEITSRLPKADPFIPAPPGRLSPTAWPGARVLEFIPAASTANPIPCSCASKMFLFCCGLGGFFLLFLMLRRGVSITLGNASQTRSGVRRDFLLFSSQKKKKNVVGWVTGRESTKSHIIKKGIFWHLRNF